MNNLTQAISQGFSPQQILSYLSRHFPKHSQQIQKALAKGFTAEQILKYLGNGRKGLNEFEGELTEHEKTRKSDVDKEKKLEKNIGKTALAIGGLGLGAYGYAKSGQALQGQLLPALPQNPPQPQLPYNPPQIPQSPSPSPQIGYQVQQRAQQPVNQAMQSQSVSAPTPISQNPTQHSLDFAQILDQIGIRNRVDAMREKNPPDLVSKAIRYGMPKNQIQELEKELGISLDQVIEGYIQNAPPNETMQEKISKGVPLKSEIEKPPIDSNVEPEQVKVEENRKVILPDGQIGEIQDIRQGIASINAEEKIRRKKLDELIESPLPEKELSDLYKDVISGIEKKTGQEVSRMVNWAGYDPKTNELAFIPHVGGLYVYDNISPEDVQALTDILSQRKSSGENFIGAWTQSTQSPIGASMSKLIQKLQKERGGKGNEYKGKFEKIYDALEPAKIASKKKFEEEKNEKRKTKKPRSSQNALFSSSNA